MLRKLIVLFLALAIAAAGGFTLFAGAIGTRTEDDAEIVGWLMLVGVMLVGAGFFLAWMVLRKNPGQVMRGARVAYAVLRHEGVDKPHFDLMIELAPGGLLATWRIQRWPIDESIPATRLGEHRRAYLEYEGEVSGGRGHVRRVARGEGILNAQDDGSFKLAIDGGTVLRLKTATGDQWLISSFPAP